MLVVTETWFRPGTSDVQVSVTGFTIHRADITTQSGKARGGGVEIHINDRLLSNNVITTTICDHEIESLSIKCRPLRLPRELSCVLIVRVYCPPSSNDINTIDTVFKIIFIHHRIISLSVTDQSRTSQWVCGLDLR